MQIRADVLISKMLEAGASRLIKFVTAPAYEVEFTKYLSKGEREVLKQEGSIFLHTSNGWIIFHPVKVA